MASIKKYIIRKAKLIHRNGKIKHLSIFNNLGKINIWMSFPHIYISIYNIIYNLVKHIYTDSSGCFPSYMSVFPVRMKIPWRQGVSIFFILSLHRIGYIVALPSPKCSLNSVESLLLQEKFWRESQFLACWLRLEVAANREEVLLLSNSGVTGPADSDGSRNLAKYWKQNCSKLQWSRRALTSGLLTRITT